MIYKNAYTGAIVKSECVIQGNGWEPVADAEPLPAAPPETPKPTETLAAQEGAEKPKARRGKK